MNKESLLRSAKTVEEAIELALLEFGVERAEVEVNVISKGRTGLLGIGGEPARVRVSLITSDSGVAGASLVVVNRLIQAMRVEALATIRSTGTGPEDPPIIEIQGTDSGLLIGRRGETLQALQFVVNLLLSRQQGEWTTVTVDVERYRERRQTALNALAHRTAERVVASGQPFTMEPMTPADRRIVHMALSDHDQVDTESVGEGSDRKVTVRPRQS